MYRLSLSCAPRSKLNDVDEGNGFKLSPRHTAMLFLGKLHFAIFLSKKSVIFAHTNIISGPILLAALAQDDLTSFDLLITVDLDPEHLWLGVLQVFGCTSRFYVCHIVYLAYSDRLLYLSGIVKIGYKNPRAVGPGRRVSTGVRRQKSPLRPAGQDANRGIRHEGSPPHPF